MQVGILGFAKAGKTTLFNLLTASSQQTDKYATSKKTHVGVAEVPDDRLRRLGDLFNPKKFTPATVTYVDIPGVKKGEGAESLDLPALRDVDALIHVVRAFEDEELLHPDGSVDPKRDVENLDLELILADHELVGRRVERLEKSRKRGLTADESRELELLEKTVLPALDNETPLREVELDPEDEKRLRGFQLLSAKPMLIALNVDEGQLGSGPDESIGSGAGVATIVISAPIEAEVAALGAEEQAEFLSDLGLDEPSVDRIIRASYELLGLASFFTVGEDEVRAWTIRQGTPARAAAGVIHSDLERGFIRAEVVPWDELLRLGSMAACRDQGVLRLEGRDYRTVDGDIMHIRSGV
jgi:GTP-binding protein YchF